MSQHDYDLANQAGAAFRSDLNAALAAIVTNNSGATEPTTTYAHMWWSDTTAGILKRRNAANSAWISVMPLTLAFSAIGESLAAAASASAARTAISAAASGANGDITSLSGLTTALSIAQGGTGAATASAARTALGLAIGTDVQAYDANLRPRVLGTGVSSTSATALDFTGIPSWVKRVTVMFNGVATSGTSRVVVRIGDSSGVASTGYLSGVSGNGTAANETSGFPISSDKASTYVFYGSITLLNISGTTWIASGAIGRSDNTNAYVSGGGRTLTGTLDRLRITTVNGTDTFTAYVNIIYE
jgi:hypothetical protein